MKVVFVKSPTGKPFNLAYNQGDTAEVSDELGNRLIKAKIAVDQKDLKGEDAGAEPSGEAVAPASEKATAKGPAKSEKATKK